MEEFIVYDLPYSTSDLEQLSKLLRDVDPIIAAWDNDNFDRYKFLFYAEQRDIHHRECRALLDLNIIADVVHLCERRRASESMRRTAALLAFLIVTDTLFDVGPGSTEFLQKHDGELANKNVRLFHLADNVNPRAYADIALGRREALGEADIPSGVPENKPFEPKMHYNWDLHYIALLKLTLISFGRGSGVAKFLEYLEWMWKDFMFSSPSFVFAAIYLSPKPYPKMIKGIGSGNPEQLIAGLRNATWDLVLAHYWAARTRESVSTDRMWIFCTFDKALRDVASNLLIASNSGTGETKFRELLSRFWPARTSPEILHAYDSYLKRKDAPGRAIKAIKDQRDFLPMIDDLEGQLRLAIRKEVCT